MRSTRFGIALLAALLATPTLAAERASLEKVKTGILPSGGFYRIYEVACRDQRLSSVATIRREQWCTLDAGNLQCFRDADDAIASACAIGTVAATDEALSDALMPGTER